MRGKCTAMMMLMFCFMMGMMMDSFSFSYVVRMTFMLDVVPQLSFSEVVGMLMDAFGLSFIVKKIVRLCITFDDVPLVISTIVIQQFYLIYDFFLLSVYSLVFALLERRNYTEHLLHKYISI